MSNRKIVKFVKPWNGYGPGEVAGFLVDKADQLVEGEVAVLFDKASSKPAGKKSAAKASGKSAQPPSPGDGDPDPNAGTDTDPNANTGGDGGADDDNDDDEKP